MSLNTTPTAVIHVALRLNQSAQTLVQEQLTKRGFAAVFLREDELVQHLPHIEYLLLGRPPRLNWSVAARLKLIHVAGTGVDPLFPAIGLSESVQITNSRGAHADAVRDHVLMLTLALTRDLARALDQQRRQEWKSYSTPSVAGQHWVVLGYGAIGQRLSHAATSLGVHVRAIARGPRANGLQEQQTSSTQDASAPGRQQLAGATSPKNVPATRNEPHPSSHGGSLQVLRLDALDGALADADAVVLCLPLTDETRGLFHQARVNRLPSRAVLINVSRGGILDEAALLARLQQGTLRGAALDVFDQEPLPAGAPHWTCPRLIVTPHNAGFTPDYLTPVLEGLFASLDALARNETPPNCVSRRLGY